MKILKSRSYYDAEYKLSWLEVSRILEKICPMDVDMFEYYEEDNEIEIHCYEFLRCCFTNVYEVHISSEEYEFLEKLAEICEDHDENYLILEF